MPRRRRDEEEGGEPKEYRAGDQIHITITQGFADAATEFFAFCKKHQFNPSEVIRGGMKTWLERQKKIQEQYEKSEFYQNEIISDIVEAYPWLKETLRGRR